MSYEAVPCMVTAPSQDGTKGTILGVIIRPSSSQEGTPGKSLNTPPGIIPIKGAKPIVIQPGSKRSLILSNDQIQKMVTGRGLRSMHTPITTSSVSSSIFNRTLTSPHCVDANLSPSPSFRINSGLDCISSCTPDSGIQSVPTTPPQTSRDHKGEEKAEDETKFDDMPTLRPMDEEERTTVERTTRSSSSRPPPLDESSHWNSSECETSLPSSLTKTSWNPEEIATQLLSMAAFDPRKIQEVTALMLQRSKEDAGKTGQNEKKRKKDKKEGIIETKIMRREYCDSRPSTSKEHTDVEENKDVSEEEPRDEYSTLVLYRLAMKRRLLNLVEETSDRVFDRFSRIKIGENIWKKEDTLINPLFSKIQWDIINSRKLSLSEILKKEMKEKSKENEDKRRHRKRRNNEIMKESIEPMKRFKGRKEKELDDFDFIKFNEIVDGESLPSLPSLPSCDCTRGGCLSSIECLHRSLSSFCTNIDCSLPSCSNRLSSSSNLFLSHRILKTKEPKKANEFLTEIVGEVISVSTLTSRLSSHSSDSLRVFSFTPNHFIDSTKRGNISRYVKHSCKPNSSIQIWWEWGIPRLCIFSLFPIASDSEITVDLSFITPLPFHCTCSHRCGRLIAPSVALSLHNSKLHPPPPSNRLFLRRNLRYDSRIEKFNKSPLFVFYLFVNCKFRRNDGRVNGVFATYLHRLRRAAVHDSKDLFVSLISQMIKITKDAVDTHSLSCIRNRLIRSEQKEENEKEKNKLRKRESNSSRQTDISYLDSYPPVGSYNVDEWRGGDTSRDEGVRCVCGVVEDDGEMVECDECHYWLHSDCIQTPSVGTFSCSLCLNSTPSPHGDVILKNQPDIRLDGCIYYKALENSNKIQIRVGECVYTRRLKSDKHKKILRNLEQKKGKRNEITKEDSICVDTGETLIPRSALRVFRVERLFETTSGHRFLFGFYYARPHETFCEESRMFHPNEVFATPFYDTLPLDVVVGKCIVMDTTQFCEGRPIFPSYEEQDVLLCEYQLDRNQRHFDKCRNKYFLNTQPYAFKKFVRARSLKRSFTPFTYSSNPRVSTFSQEDTNRLLHQLSTKRLKTVVDRLTSNRI